MKRVAKVLYLVLLSISPGYGWNSCCRPSFAEISLRSCVTYTRKPSTLPLALINYRLCSPVGGGERRGTEFLRRNLLAPLFLLLLLLLPDRSRPLLKFHLIIFHRTNNLCIIRKMAPFPSPSGWQGIEGGRKEEKGEGRGWNVVEIQRGTRWDFVDHLSDVFFPIKN